MGGRENRRDVRPAVNIWMLVSLGLAIILLLVLITGFGVVRPTAIPTKTVQAHADAEVIARKAVDKTNSDLTGVFQKIYDKKLWTAAGGGSGAGSTLEFTASLRHQLVQLLSRYKIKHLVDLSCGAMVWMPLVLDEMKTSDSYFKYTGQDVACGVIEQNKQKFQEQDFMSFACLDATKDPLPSDCGLAFTRHTLSHLSYSLAYSFFANIKASSCKYLLVDTQGYKATENLNRNIEPGSYYPMDVAKAPFKLRPVLEFFEEKYLDEPDTSRHYMLLYKVEEMQWDPMPQP